MADQKTIDVYAQRAGDYARIVRGDKPRSDLRAFIEALPAGARVLDWGCGPGADSAQMRAAGLRPDPVDACAQMVALANETFQVGARLGTFDQLDAEAAYDGVWASFSLLHAPRAALPGHLHAMTRALRPGGRCCLGMKTGTGEGRDALGRCYTYVGVAELGQLLQEVGLTVVRLREGVGRGLAGTEDPYVIVHATRD